MIFLENLKNNFFRILKLNLLNEKSPNQVVEDKNFTKETFQNDEWFKKLTPEKQEEYTNLHDELSDLQNKEELKKGALKFIKEYGKSVNEMIGKVEKTEDKNDTEFIDFLTIMQKKLKSLGQEFKENSEEKRALSIQIVNLQRKLEEIERVV